MDSDHTRWKPCTQSKRLVTPNSGYQYRTKEGTDIVEYHVDSSHLFEERMRRETRFGGQLSVWREPNVDDWLHIIFGHDKSIFKQYHMMKKAWGASNSKRVLIPKDDGQGLLISTFQSREFGFSLETNEGDLKKKWTNGIAGKNTMMSQQQNENEEQVTKMTYLQVHLLLSLNMVPPMKDIGHMITWSCSWMIVWTV